MTERRARKTAERRTGSPAGTGRATAVEIAAGSTAVKDLELIPVEFGRLVCEQSRKSCRC
jgi:hypothetical protein